MASAGGRAWATDEIPDVEMEAVDRRPEEPGWVGSKRARGSPSALGSYGFYGGTTAENKKLNKAFNVNHLHMNSDDASKVRVRYMHGSHGLESPDSNALRLSSSSPGENLENKTKRATTICTSYAQGWCKKGNSCTFLHAREGLGSAKVGLLAPACSEIRRGSEEGSQGQHQPNLKAPQFKDAKGSSNDERYRSLIHVYGEDNEKLAHLGHRQNSTIPVVSQGLPSTVDDSLTGRPTAPINGLVQNLVHEQNHNPFMGRHIGLATETYLDGRGTLPRLPDGGTFRSGVDQRNSCSDSYVSRTSLDVDTLSSDHQFRSFRPSVSSDPLQLSEKLSAYGGIIENLPSTYQEELHSSHAPYGSSSLTGFRNPGYATSEISLGSQTLRTTSQLGVQSPQMFTTGIEKVNLHRYIDADNGGCGTSRPALLSSSSLEPSIISAEPLSPIKDEVWETSVPFVPSFDFPYSTSPPGKQYDPFVDCIEPPKVGNTDNLKSSNISFNITSQHTNQYVITDKSPSRNEKLARNMSANGANGPAWLITSDRGRSSSLDDNNRVKSSDGKNCAASNDEKARDFRFLLAEHIKELIRPIWKEGNLSKDAHKLVVKKCVEKIVDSIEPNQVPTTEELIAKYITNFGSKIEKLVKAYVDRIRAK